MVNQGMRHGAPWQAVKFFSFDAAGNVLYWPLWWYSRGLGWLVMTLVATLKEESRRLGLGRWWRHVGVPMYGQTDWQGRIISFAVRLVVGAGRTVVWLAWVSLAMMILAVWVLVLPVAGYFFWINFSDFAAWRFSG